jgi:hypothetical protein
LVAMLPRGVATHRVTIGGFGVAGLPRNSIYSALGPLIALIARVKGEWGLKFILTTERTCLKSKLD